MEKQCNTCGEIKALELFYKNRGMVDGYYNRCKDCQKVYFKEYHNSEKGKATRARLAEAVKTPPKEKKCSKCKQILPAESFPRSNIHKTGLYSYCFPCKNIASTESKKKNRHAIIAYNNREDVKQRRLARDYLKKYGIELKDYDLMLEAQGGGCQICKSTDPKGQGRFHVDHNHETGEVRGLLCSHCNTGLGMFKDSPALLISAAAYLEDKGSYGK